MRSNLYFLFGALALLLLVPSPPAAAQAGSTRPSSPVQRSADPLSHDPRRPNTYDMDNELRNSKIGRELELTLNEANAAFGATPPRYADAERGYRRAIELAPKDGRAYVGLGTIYAAQNEAEKAVAQFEKAVEVKPKYAEAHFNLALICFAIGRKTEALEHQHILEGLNKPLAKKLEEAISATAH
jgi:tetratricopeptide (TPR) repeat protein